MLFSDGTIQNAGRGGQGMQGQSMQGMSQSGAYGQSDRDPRYGGGGSYSDPRQASAGGRGYEDMGSGSGYGMGSSGYGMEHGMGQGGSGYGDRNYGAQDRSYGAQDQSYGAHGRSGHDSPSRGGGGSYAMDRDYERGSRGQSPYGGQEQISAMAPLAWSREMFVNVHVTEVENNDVIKSVGNWVGSLTRTKQQHHEKTANELAPLLCEIVRQVMDVHHGWNAEVALMLLPPSHGMLQWAPSLRIGNDALPILMVFRVYCHSRRRDRGETSGFAEMFGSCCDMFIPPAGIQQEDFEQVGMSIQDSLRRLRSPHPSVRAQIEVMDAPHEWQVLHSRGWSEEQSTSAITRARSGHQDQGDGFRESGLRDPAMAAGGALGEGFRHGGGGGGRQNRRGSLTGPDNAGPFYGAGRY